MKLARWSMHGHLCALAVITLCVAWVVVPAAQSGVAEPPFGEPASFHVDKASLRGQPASSNLIARMDASAFRYFRTLARQFAQRTCFEFRNLRWRLPSVAVHGDPHLEQFVITGHSYGLEDFDWAGFGPSVVDLVRYAASLHLACREVGWSCNGSQAANRYFEAYRAALDRPVDRAEPSIVTRLRADVDSDQLAWLSRTVALIRPIPASDEDRFRRGWRRFVDLMRETRPERPESFYRIIRAGTIEVGVGSALEPKVLVRIAGATDADNDDLILEARVTAMPTGLECVSRPTNGGSLQVLMFTALLGPRLPDVFGFLPREGEREAPEFWVQSWDPGYRELLLSDVRTQAELNQLAVDAGYQLAGHFWTKFPEPLRAQQRFAQLRAFEMTDDRARDLARRFADDVVDEWRRFRSQP